jgi:hypothetical protein
MSIRLFATLAVALVLGGRVAAHDFWLAAEPWHPAPGAPVTVTAGVGERFPARTDFRLRDNWLTEWRLIGPSGDVPVSRAFRRKDLAMAIDLTLPSPGAYMGVALVSPQRIEMKGPEFTEYLKQEGLEAIIAARQAAGGADTVTSERYARYAKIALRTGRGSGLHLIRPAGLRAEFVPAIDPTDLAPGAPITVQLLVEGKPVSGSTVSAVSADTVMRATTDSQGLATFSMDHPGAWLIRTVHMVRLPPSADAEWESYWVTLAFHTAQH